MLLPCFAPIPLSDKIEAWRQEVVRQTLGPQETNGGAGHLQSTHGMKLRSSTSRPITSHSLHDRYQRPILAEIPLPNHPKKRKASDHRPIQEKRQKRTAKGVTKVTMTKPEPSKDQGDVQEEKDYTPEGQGPPHKRRPGRPRKNDSNPPTSTVEHRTSKVLLNDAPSLASSDSQSRHSIPLRQSSRSRKASPEKTPSTPRRGKSMDDDLKKGDLVPSYLAKCEPPVYLRSFSDIQQRFAVPVKARQLYDLLDSIPTGATISRGLQQAYDEDANTPKGSKPAPRDHQYSLPSMDPFPPEELPHLKNFTTRIMQQAEFSAIMDAHEGQWGNIVGRILNAFDLWPEGESVQSINVETEPIAPRELRPSVHAAGAAPQASGRNSQDGSNTTGTDAGKDSTIGKMVDWVMALTLSWKDQDYIQDAFSTIVEVNMHSVNQTRGFAHLSPMWLYLELKTHYQAIDPRIQLAVFAVAGISKRRIMGWDTSFPTPGITAEGHQWRLYIFFEMNEKIMMMGPLMIGSTESRTGMWHLMRSMHALVEWGATQYRQWFNDVVLDWAKRTVPSKASSVV
ncbi:MAG: hypothetical protein Q9194_002359 [Teloschistes cf. exilis]